MKKSIRRNPNLRYNKPQLLRLEPRIMFDGAAVDTTAEVVGDHGGGAMDPAMEQIEAAMEQSFGPAATQAPQDAAQAPADLSDIPLLALTESAELHQQLLADAASLANDKLAEWVNSDDFRTQAAEIFSADANSAEWNAQLDALRTDILNGSYAIRLEVRSNDEMNGTRGAYSAMGTTGQPTIYLNAQWLTDAQTNEVAAVLLQEIGHDIDNRLNSGADSQGDEGAAFASLLTTGNANLAVNRLSDDRTQITLDGEQVRVEHAGPYNIAQVHFVTMPEDQIWSGIQNIYSSSSDNKIESIIAITATSNDTYVVYDHWEDGYEANINNPGQTNTRIWYYNEGKWTDVNTGLELTDGQTVNGVTAMGQSLILRNQVNKNSLATIDFDGRDKIGSTKAISVTRAGWDTKIGTIVGGAVNIIDVGNAGREFVIPVGSDTAGAPKISSTSIFQKNSLYIMAYEDNTTVTVQLDGGTITRTLMQGESLYIKGLATGGTFKAGTGLNDAQAVVNDGTRITSDKAIGVNMLSGSNTSQNRWYSIAATESWGSSYYAPVATVGGATSHIYLHNDNGTAIDVKYETRNASGVVTINTVTVAAHSTAVVAMPASAGHFYTENGEKFYAVATVDPTTSRDWSYSLVAERTLTDRFVVAWGPGNGNTAGSDGVISGKNGSPVWVTAVDDTYLYIDSGTTELVDAQGNSIVKDATLSAAATTAAGHDVSVYKIDRLQSYRLRDTSDRNQTGLVVYTVDGTLITAAWGEDATVADTGSPYLDMGTTISPYPDYVLEKKAAEIVNHGRETGVIEAGDEVKYTITLTNRAVIELLNIRLTDKIDPPGSATYVDDSLTLTSFDENGKKVWQIAYDTGTSTYVKTYYQADGTTVDTTKGSGGTETDTTLLHNVTGEPLLLTSGGYLITNAIDRNPDRNGLQIGGYIQFTYKVTINETIDKTLADANFIVSNSVKLQADGVEKDKINKIDLSGTITDGVVTFISGEDDTEVTSFEPGNDIWIRVTDNDQNRDATTKQTIEVVLINETTGEREIVELEETDINSGIFEGKVNTTKGTGSASDNQTDGNFKLKRGDEIRVEYTDPISGGDPSQPGYDASKYIDNPTNPGITGDYQNGGINNNVKTLVVEDSGISVNDILVNEASPYGVFTVQGAQGQEVKLELSDTNGTATMGSVAAPGVDFLNSLEYYDVTDGVWKPYTTSTYVEIKNADGTLLVRNPIKNDDVYEGAETYELKVTPKKNDDSDGSSTTGTATIFDDGTGTIWKDPAGPSPADPTGEDPTAPKDHDRYPMVDNPVVNEGSGHVVFTVTTQPGDTIKANGLTLGDGTATGGTQAEFDALTQPAGGVDYKNDSFEYWDPSANAGTGGWVIYDDSQQITVATGTLYVRVAIFNDTLYEQSETFKLNVETVTDGKATGTATIKDDGTGVLYPTDDPADPGKSTDVPDPSAPAYNDHDSVIIKVDNPVVNEASGYVVFTVTNTDSNAVNVDLSLISGTASPSSTAPAYGESNKDYYPDSFEYWSGIAWVEYTPGTSPSVTIAATDELQVRVKIYNDTVYEGAETFELDVTFAGGSMSVKGTATILDDGTGTIWVPEKPGTLGQPKDPSNPNQPGGPTDKLIPYEPTDDLPNLPFNDDRTPFVTSPTVNEGSEYVVFEVTTVKGEVLSSLAFADNTAKVGTVDNTPGSTMPRDGSVDYNTVLQYSTDNGASWTTYTSGDISVPDGKLLVRTKIANDDDYEVSENFNLTVTVKSDGKKATGVATILDDGTGTIFNPNGTEDTTTPKDDDRPVTVNSPTVNEGSGWIVFEVGGITGTPITSLVLGDDTTPGVKLATAEMDYGTQLQYFDTSDGQWKNWNEGSTTTTIPAGGTLLVRTTIVNDAEFEKSETFTLKATTKGGKEATGTGTIKDDGTGTIWIPEDPGNSGQPKDPTNPADPGTVTDKLIPKVPTGPVVPNLSFDDDRSIAITNGGTLSGSTVTPASVKENANHVFFEVSGVAEGELVNLVLADGVTNPATTSGFFMDYSTDGGVTWTRYDGAANRPVAPSGGKILVRVNIDSENDPGLDDNETFTLTASYASNPAKNAAGTGTLIDQTVGAPKITPNDGNGGDNGHATVSEKGLTSSGDTSETTTGTILLEADDGIASIYLGDKPFTKDELLNWATTPVEITTSKGILTVTGITITDGDATTPKKITLNYEYTLTNPQHHQDGMGPIEVLDEIQLAVSDGTRSSEGSLNILILDDTPTATNDERGVSTGTRLDVNAAGGVLANDDPGADGWRDVGGVVGVKAGLDSTPITTGIDTPITSAHGTLILHADGSFSYTATSGSIGDTDVFTYTVRDADGDETTATLTITIKPLPQDDTRVGQEDTPVTGNVIKDGGPGDQPDIAPGETGKVQVIEVTVGGVSKPVEPGVPTVFDLTEGTLTFNSDGSYRFDPTPDWNGDVPEITYDLAYGDGATDSTATAKLNITIEPVKDAFDDTTSTIPGTPVRTEVLGNDKFSNPGNRVEIVTPPANGTVVVNPDGSTTYTPTPDFTGETSYTYRVITPEGIWEDAVVNIRVDSLPPVVEPPVPGESLPPYVEPPVPPQDTAPSPHLGLDTTGEMPPYDVGKDVFDDWDQPQYEYELLLEKKIPDQPLEEGKEMSFLIPKDTFRHTDPSAKLTLVAAQLDGSPLPDWLTFDSATGGFSGTPPAGFSGEMLIRVVARDGANRQVETIVRMGDKVVDPSMPPYEVGKDPAVGEAGKSGEYELLLEKKIPDQPLGEGKEIDFLVPQDTFRHTDPSAKLTLSAAMVDGSPLPDWLKFDPNTGGFKGTPPAGTKGEMLIKVIAKDEAGRQVETILRISDQIEPSYAVSIDTSLMVDGMHVLKVAKAVPDLLMPFEADGAASIDYVIPMDAFVHSDPNAQVDLSAMMLDGSELPDWLEFDPKTGKFKGIPPKGFKGELQIKVIARDQDGRQAETILRIKVGDPKAEKQGTQAIKGKPSLTSMLKTQGSWAWKAERDRLVKLGQEVDRIKAGLTKTG